MKRPWNGITYTDDESPWSEYAAFEDWLKQMLPDDESREYYDAAPAGFSSYLYAGLASAFDASNDRINRPEKDKEENDAKD